MSSRLDESESQSLIELLIRNKCLKFGQFTLKSGLISDHYVDLRESTESPILFEKILDSIINVILKEVHSTDEKCPNLSLDHLERVAIVGVPYGVVPLAGAVAARLKIPYVAVRKEMKDYGNKSKSDSLKDYAHIVIEDVMSTGSSIIGTIEKLDGRKVTDVIVIVDRLAGGVENIKKAFPDIKVHSILNINQIMKWKDTES